MITKIKKNNNSENRKRITSKYEKKSKQQKIKKKKRLKKIKQKENEKLIIALFHDLQNGQRGREARTYTFNNNRIRVVHTCMLTCTYG